MRQHRPAIANDEMRAEYDFSQGVRGKHHESYRAGTNVVFLDADLVQEFPDSDAVNQALRLLVRLARTEGVVGGRPNTYQPSPRQERRSSPAGRRVTKTRDRNP
jgi:hypothetical protein